MRKHFKIAILLGILGTAVSLQSCKAFCKSKTKEMETAVGESQSKKSVVKTPVTTIDLRFLDSDVVTVLPNDFALIIETLEKTKYDKKWNETGMMVKMKTPDYSLTMLSDAVAPTMVFIWSEGGRVKIDEKWYLLSSADSEKLSAFLTKYKGGFNK